MLTKLPNLVKSHKSFC